MELLKIFSLFLNSMVDWTFSFFFFFLLSIGSEAEVSDSESSSEAELSILESLVLEIDSEAEVSESVSSSEAGLSILAYTTDFASEASDESLSEEESTISSTRLCRRCLLGHRPKQ